MRISTNDRSEPERRGTHPSARERRLGRRSRPARVGDPFAMTPFGPERLEERTLLATALSPAVVQALIAPVSDSNQTGGGLAVLQEWASDLNNSGSFGQTLPIVDQSIGSLINLGQQVSTQILGPASTYLAPANTSPTAEGLLAAIAAAASSSGDSFSLAGTKDIFTLPNLTVSSTAQFPIDLGGALNIAVDRSVLVNVTTSLALSLSFSVDTSTNAFAVTINSSHLSASIAVPNVSAGVDFGILAGQISGGSLAMTAGLDFQSLSGAGLSIGQLFGSETSYVGVLSTSTSASSSLAATLPMTFSLDGQSLTTDPMHLPTVSLADTDPFHKAPTVTTANFANLINFSNVVPSRLLSLLDNLGSTFGQLSTSSILATPLPFTQTTVGQVLDFGAAFADKVTNGLQTIATPTAAPTASGSGGGSTGGSLAPGTYFAEFTFANATGESAPSPVSSTFTVPAGAVPQITLPLAPSGLKINLYLSDSKATTGSATLYRSGITATSTNLDAAAPSGAISAPTAATRTPLFGSAQDLATLLGQLLATPGGSAFRVNPTFLPASGTNPDELTFQVSFSDAPTNLLLPIDFHLALGSIAGITTNAMLQVSPDVNMSFTFGIDLDPEAASISGTTPAAPALVGSPLAPLPTDGQINSGASFTLTIGANAAVPVTLPASALAAVTSIANPANPLDPATLVGQINLALGAISFGSGKLGNYVVAGVQDGNIALTLARLDRGTSLTIGVPNSATNPVATVLGFSDGQAIGLAPLRSGPGVANPVATPIPANGQLGASSSFTVTIGGTAYPVSLPLAATSGDTSISNPADPTDLSTLVGRLNQALVAAGVGSEVIAGYSNGNITLTLRAFDKGPTLELGFADGDPMGTVLGFTNLQAVHASSGDLFVQNVQASGSVGLAVMQPAGVAPFASASIGPLSLAIGSALFSASGSVQLQIARGNPINLSTLIGDFGNLAGIESVVSVTPSASISANFAGFSVAAGDDFSFTPPSNPSLTVTALDPLDAANTLSLGDTTEGELGADLYFQVALDGKPSVTIHIPQAATTANASVGGLVLEIDAALATAFGSNTVQATATDDGTTTRISFGLAGTDKVDTAVLAEHFVTVLYANFGTLLNFSHLGLADIAGDIQQAVQGLSTYASFGFLNDKLPIIDKSVVDLVNYGALFATAFGNLQTDPNGTLQGYGDAIAGALGLAPGDLKLSYDAANQALKILLVFQPAAYDQYLPLDLDLASLAAETSNSTAQAFLQGLSSLIDLSGKSRVHVMAGVTVTLDLGLTLNPSNAPSAFLYNDTGVALTALIVASNASFNASVGPLALTIQGASATLSADGSSTTLPASFTLGISPSVTNPTLLNFLGNLTADTAVTLRAGANLTLPMSLQGAALGTFTATVPDVGKLLAGSPGAVAISTPNIKGALQGLGSLSSLLRNPTIFLQPLNSLLGGLQATLNSQLLATELPLIGSHLQDGAQFIATIQNDILGPINAAIKANNGDAGAAIAAAMQTALRAIDPNATVTAVYPPDGNSVQFDLHLGGVEDESEPFDLGLSALGLGLTGTVALALNWTVNLDVGLSTTEGFYVLANPTSPSGSAVPMIAVAMSVTLPGSSFTGSLGFLQFSATDNPGNDPNVTIPGGTTPALATGLAGSLTVGLNGSGTPDGRLTLASIAGGSLGGLLQVQLNANASVNLHLLTTVAGNSMFPSFSTDFVLNWPIANYTYGQKGPLGASPQVAFENVELGLGTFISNFVEPILDKIKPIFDAVEPVVNILTERIPVISDLAGRTISLASLAEALDPKDAGNIQAFLADFQNIYSLINEVSAAGGGPLNISFGSFNLGSLLGDLRGMKSVASASFDPSKLPSFQDLADQLSTAPASQASFTKSITKTGGSLQFPIIQDPSSVFQLLLGQTIDLFTYSTPTLSFNFSYTQVFPIFGPLVAMLGGNVGASIHFSFGYDTYGVQEWAHAGFAPSELVPDLADGFYAVADGTPNVILNAGITAGAGIDLGLISGGVQGGIYATIDMALNDPDGTGKLRLETFINELADPLSIFHVSGRVYAQLSAYLTIDLFFFSTTYNFDITPEITLVTFDSTPAVAQPTLAAVSSNGALTLNTGPNSAARGTGNTNQGDQSFVVRHLSGSGTNEAVAVTAYGYTTTYSGVQSINATGGLGNDTIDLTGVQANATITGGQGHNTIIGGSGTNTLVESGFTNYTLTSGGLLMDGSNSDTFQNIQVVKLAGPSGGHGSFNLKGYVGDSTLQGQGGNNTYNVDLSADGTTTITDSGTGGNPDAVNITLADGTPATIAATNVKQGVNTIDYSGDALMTTLTVNGTQANTQYTILDTPLGPVATTLNTGDGNDTVFVERTSGPTTINAGAGNTAIDLGSQDAGPGGVLRAIQGTLNVATVIGNVTLNADDTGDTAAASATLTASSLTGLGMGLGGVNYSNITNLDLNLGSGGTTVAILGTLGFNTTKISSLASGNTRNTFDVGTAAPGSGGLASGVAGPLVVQGSGRDTLNLDDSGDTASQALLVTGGMITQLGMSASQGIAYSGLSTLRIALGTGGDSVAVQGTNGSTATTIAGAVGSKANTFRVGSLAPTLGGGVVAGIAGPLAIAGSGADTLLVDNTGDTAHRFATLTDATLTGLGMGGQGITFSGLGTLTIHLGPGGNTLTVAITNDLPALTTVTAGTSADTATLTYQHNLDGVLNLVGFLTAPTSSVAGNLYGDLNLTEYQTVPYLAIGGSVEPGAVITGVNIIKMTVGGSFYGELDLTGNLGEMDVAGDVTGLVNVAGTLARAVVQGGTPGVFEAHAVGVIDTLAGYGPVVSQVIENGIERRVAAAAVGSNPYPLAAPLHQTTTAPSPGQVTFRSMYEGMASNGLGVALASPQVSLRVIQAAAKPGSQQYDLSFDTWNDAAKYNLARLDVVNSSGGPAASGIRDVSVDGDVLNQVTPAGQAFLGLSTNQGGIRLPLDNLAGVGIRDYAPQRAIQAASIQSVAFGSASQDNGKVIDGSQANYTNAGELLTTSTAFSQATNGTTFRVPFADKHNVALFFVSLANTHNFDLQGVVFADEHSQGGIASDPRGGVTALVTTNLALAGTAPGTTRRAQLTSVALTGDGGSFTTGQWITGSITSTGALGDVTLSNGQGLTASLTAPSIFGSIKALSGPIAGTIQATGLRIDPITGASSAVPGTIGQLTVGPTGTIADTQILAGSGGITGKILAAGDLISQVVSRGPISGLIATAGNLGATASGPGGTMLRFGGISSQGLLSGQVVAVGNILGDLAFQGGMAGGQVAAQGSIIGNLTVNGPFDARSAIIAGGTIGGGSSGTSLTIAAPPGGATGLVAAKGAVRLAPTGSRPTNLYQALPSGPNASAIDALFAQIETDLTSSTPAIVGHDPAKLKVVAGQLTFVR